MVKISQINKIYQEWKWCIEHGKELEAECWFKILGRLADAT